MKINSNKYKQSFAKFKKSVEEKLGRINWKKVGRASLVILVVAALSGLLGPKAQIVSIAFVRSQVFV